MAAVLASLAAALMVVLGVPAPAGADGLEVTGNFTGTGSFNPDGTIFHTWHDIAGTWTGLGEITAHLAYDVDLQSSPAPSPFTGAFTITTGAGELTGDLSGVLAGGPDDEGWPGSFVLTITGGTGAYEDASGSLALDAHFVGEVAPIFAVVGTVSGSVDDGSTGPTSSTTTTTRPRPTTTTTRPPTTVPGPSTGPFAPTPPPPATPIDDPPDETG